MQQSQTLPCIVCGQVDWAPQWRVLLCCRNCGYLRADLDLDADALAALYDDNYFTGEEYGDYLADADLHRGRRATPRS